MRRLRPLTVSVRSRNELVFGEVTLGDSLRVDRILVSFRYSYFYTRESYFYCIYISRVACHAWSLCCVHPCALANAAFLTGRSGLFWIIWEDSGAFWCVRRGRGSSFTCAVSWKIREALPYGMAWERKGLAGLLVCRVLLFFT